MRTSAAVALIALALLAAGCDDQPTAIDGATAYDAGSIAREEMDELALDEESLAYGDSWVIDDTAAERLADGTWAWRVTFVATDDESTTLCMWVQLAKRTLTHDNWEYEVDRCPDYGEETAEAS